MAPVPEIVVELTGVIGADAYARLEAKLGGSRFYVPRWPDEDHVLSHAVGLATARLIGEYFHGQEIILPLGGTSRQREGRAEILRLARTGAGRDEIARTLRIHRATVYRVLADAGMPDDRQPSFFD